MYTYIAIKPKVLFSFNVCLNLVSRIPHRFSLLTLNINTSHNIKAYIAVIYIWMDSQQLLLTLTNYFGNIFTVILISLFFAAAN